MIRPTRRPRRLSLEALEGRTLMSYGGGPYLAYGTSGVAFVSFGSGENVASASAVQADGKTVVVGSLVQPPIPGTRSDLTFERPAIARFNADGSVDTGFGTNGVVSLTLSINTFSGVTSVAIQPDGKIVLAVEETGVPEVVRLNANGSLDAGFGTNGTVTLATSGPNGGSLPTVPNLAIAADGGIVFVELTPGALPGQGGTYSLAKLNADGSPDKAFGFQGSVLTDFMTYTLANIQETSSSLVIQPNGKVNFTGAEVSGGAPQGTLGVEQFNADGSLDTTFGSGAIARVPSPAGGSGFTGLTASLAVQPDGKILLGGSGGGFGPNGFLVARFTPSGQPDPGFGGLGGNSVGVAFLGQASSVSTTPLADVIAVGSDGKILIGGSKAGAAVGRLEPNGAPDPTFGQGGIAIDNGMNLSGAIVGLSVRADGVILATNSSGQVLALRTSGAAGDYNDDGLADPAAYLPFQGNFAYRPSGGAPDVLFRFGASIGVGQNIPTPGYYDGSGQSEVGVYLPTQGSFAYRPSQGGNDVVIPFGIPGAGQTIPAVGYYDGSGRQNIAAYLPSLGIYAIRPFQLDPSTVVKDELVSFGIAGAGQSIPVPGDYEGTGVDDIAVYLPSLGAYAIRPSTGGPDKIIPFGVAGMGQSIPMPGDYDGSGKTELAVYIPSQGVFAYRPANGGADVIVQFGIAGPGQTLPASGDYTGSGHDELGVYLPSLGLYAYRPGLPNAATGPDVVLPFGPAGVGQTIPFNGVPASNTLPTTVSAASVSAESTSWIDVVPSATRPKKSANDRGTVVVPVLG